MPEEEDSSEEEDLAKRAASACAKVRQGEVSRARQVLVSTGLAPGNADTLAELTNPELRPPELTEPLPDELLQLRPPERLNLDRQALVSALRSARRGSAADLSGTRNEHLKDLLEDEDAWEAFGELSEAFARAEAPQEVTEALALGRLAALRKDNGKVRGIVTGDTFRRVVSRALAKQYSEVFERCTAPFQFALQTRAGTDALGLALRAFTDLDESAVVLSLDGIGAFDHMAGVRRTIWPRWSPSS